VPPNINNVHSAYLVSPIDARTYTIRLATTPPHLRSRHQRPDPAGSPKVNDDLHDLTHKIIRRR